MGGCFKSIGCLVVAIAFAVGGWFTRDMLDAAPHGAPRIIRPRRQRRCTRRARGSSPLPRGQCVRGRIIERLASRNGPVYANVDPADLTAYIIQQLSHQLPESARDVEATVSGDQLLVRCSVNPNDLGDLSQLGPLASMLGDREKVQMGGTLDIVKLGLGEYRLQSFRIHDFALPRAMIPRLIKSYSKGARPARHRRRRAAAHHAGAHR